MAGYSSTPLAKKLGIKEAHRVALVGAPEGFDATLGPPPDGATVRRDAKRTRGLDVVVVFVTTERELAKRLAPLVRALTPTGGLWIAWPKKASGVATDVTESVVRRHGLASGLVDNKVCAIDAVWSGLRFVYRVADRPRAKRA